MKKFTFVEEYIEVISGYRDPETNKTHAGTFWFTFSPIISLARYDVSVLDSMNEAVVAGKALTIRQGELAVKIISKYQRQLAAKNIDTTPVLTPSWRMPLRVMDYSKKLYIENDQIMIEFPFNDKLIEGLREFRKGSQGNGEWNKERRRWCYDLTEYNISYLITWARANEFEIDAECVRYEQLISEVEQTEYAIELEFHDGELRIKNAANSLIEYINEHCGGFGIDNLARLVDLSSSLAYTVNEDIRTAWTTQHSDMNYFLSTNNQVKFKPDNYSTLASVLDYADLVQRWPVVIYEPDTSNRMLGQLCNHRSKSDILTQRGKTTIDLDLIKEYKYIHTTVPLRNLNIPLLVSTAGMLFGGVKSLMLQNSEKQVYFAAEVHTNSKDTKIPLYGEIINEQEGEDSQ